jgi:hypothetical protein
VVKPRSESFGAVLCRKVYSPNFVEVEFSEVHISHSPSPMPQSQAALTFAQWGTPPARVPHSPPWWYQSTFPLRRKRPFAANAKFVRALQRVTISLSRACLYPPPPRRPGFSIACVPVLRDDFLMYISGRIVMRCT